MSISKMARKMSLAEAKAQYVQRYTAEHVPAWALKVRDDYTYYAPQFASDAEWYECSRFPGDPDYTGLNGDCQSGAPTWPLGESLMKPFNRKAFADIYSRVAAEVITPRENALLDEYTDHAFRIIRTPAASSYQDALAKLFVVADRGRKLKLIAAFGEDLKP